MPTTGSCLCRAVRISYDGEPIEIAICHCTDCRRTSTLPLYKIPRPNFHITHGADRLKCVETPTASGSTATTFFCADCGTTIYRAGPLTGVEAEQNVHLRAGVLDDVELVNSDAMRPTVEVWVHRRPGWVGAVEGADQRG